MPDMSTRHANTIRQHELSTEHQLAQYGCGESFAPAPEGQHARIIERHESDRKHLAWVASGARAVAPKRQQILSAMWASTSGRVVAPSPTPPLDPGPSVAAASFSAYNRRYSLRTPRGIGYSRRSGGNFKSCHIPISGAP